MGMSGKAEMRQWGKKDGEGKKEGEIVKRRNGKHEYVRDQ